MHDEDAHAGSNSIEVLRPVLIPRVVTIAALNAILYIGASLLHSKSYSDAALLISTFAILGYAAAVILRARDVAHSPELHPTDAAICRCSGPLLPAVMAGFVGIFIFIDWLDLREPTFIRILPLLHLAIGFILEIGTILGVIVLCAPRTRLAYPAWIWKLLSLPFLLLYVSLLMIWSFILIFEVVHK